MKYVVFRTDFDSKILEISRNVDFVSYIIVIITLHFEDSEIFTDRGRIAAE